MYYLLIGGPAHGTEREIANGENDVTIFSPSPGNPVPTPFKYVRRYIEAETRPGIMFRRIVYVEQSITPEIATQALAAVLLQNFAQELVRQYMEGGVQVGNVEEESIPSGVDTERLQRSASGSRDIAPGIVLIGE